MSGREVVDIMAQSLAKDSTLTPDDYRKLFTTDREEDEVTYIAGNAIDLLILSKIEKGEDVTEFLAVAKDHRFISRCIVTPSTNVSDDVLTKYITTDLFKGSCSRAWGYLLTAYKRDCLERFVKILSQSGTDINEVFAYRLTRNWKKDLDCLKTVAAHCDMSRVKSILETEYTGEEKHLERALTLLTEIQ